MPPRLPLAHLARDLWLVARKHPLKGSKVSVTCHVRELQGRVLVQLQHETRTMLALVALASLCLSVCQRLVSPLLEAVGGTLCWGLVMSWPLAHFSPLWVPCAKRTGELWALTPPD